MTERGHPANEMGPELLAHVERELLLDLRHYGVSTEGFSFDWSNPCQEGHRTEFLDGHLEEMSDVRVIDRIGRPQAQGWIDFVTAVCPTGARNFARLKENTMLGGVRIRWLRPGALNGARDEQRQAPQRSGWNSFSFASLLHRSSTGASWS